VAKRAFDVLVSALLLIVLFPLFIALAVAIKLDTRGPVLYRARRVGRGGRNFPMLKFRKMHADAAGGPLTLRDDERLTRVGRFLARSKLDELPQLWNVLRGEMSLVGPRPEDPLFVEQHAELFRDILRARPGITGFAQLAFRSESELIDPTDPAGDYAARLLPLKLELDRAYIACRSLRVDAAVVLWTAIAILGARPHLFRLCKSRLGEFAEPQARNHFLELFGSTGGRTRQ
jgi:lipopolysaccharide/colanic/teichoic acid biosynthesis glycosyltransferase